MHKQNKRIIPPKIVSKNQVIGYHGIGSFILTNKNIYGIVCGIDSWFLNLKKYLHTINKQTNNQFKTEVKKYVFHNFRVEQIYDEKGFISPPSVEEDISAGKQWTLPLRRFPTLEYCTNSKCRSIVHFSLKNKNKETSILYKNRCVECAEKTETGEKTFSTEQIPLIYICGKGHVDEIQYKKVAHFNNPSTEDCKTGKYKYYKSNDVENPTIECLTCGSKNKLKQYTQNVERECSGRKPWIKYYFYDKKCAEKMTMVFIPSSETYTPIVDSYIHVPLNSQYSETLLYILDELKYSNPNWFKGTPNGKTLKEITEKVKEEIGNTKNHEITEEIVKKTHNRINNLPFKNIRRQKKTDIFFPRI